jgi:hypothetical protein
VVVAVVWLARPPFSAAGAHSAGTERRPAFPAGYVPGHSSVPHFEATACLRQCGKFNLIPISKDRALALTI